MHWIKRVRVVCGEKPIGDIGPSSGKGSEAAHAYFPSCSAESCHIGHCQ